MDTRNTLVGLLLALGLAACAGKPVASSAPPAEAVVAPAPVDAGARVDTSAPQAPETLADAGREAAGDAGAAATQVVDDATDAVAQGDAGADGDAFDPPALPPPAHGPDVHDPWEAWNRKVHRFNNAVDRNVATPLARTYVRVVPRPMRLGVSNFFNNLGQPVSALNALLQGKPVQAGQSLGRFVLNFTLGIGGLFDPATDAGIPMRSEDFGQTLGVWGWERSRYVELPLLGPRTLRDTFGLAGDAPLSPVRAVDDNSGRMALQALRALDVRTQLFAVDELREGAADEYALVRDAWLQRRAYQIHGDRNRDGEVALPDYMLDDDDEGDRTIPVDVIPVVPSLP